MNKRVIYRCKKCGWEGSVTAQWADIKPIFCPNEKCQLSKVKSKGKKSFRSEPESLKIIVPKEEKKEVVKKESPAEPKVTPKTTPKKSTKKKESDEEKADSGKSQD